MNLNSPHQEPRISTAFTDLLSSWPRDPIFHQSFMFDLKVSEVHFLSKTRVLHDTEDPASWQMMSAILLNWLAPSHFLSSFLSSPPQDTSCFHKEHLKTVIPRGLMPCPEMCAGTSDVLMDKHQSCQTAPQDSHNPGSTGSRKPSPSVKAPSEANHPRALQIQCLF